VLETLASVTVPGIEGMWREKSRDLGKSRAYSALPITSSELRAQLGILLVEAFVEFLDEVVDQETKKEVRTTLVRDKQLPHTSFKALATGILAKLGEKVAGEAGKKSPVKSSARRRSRRRRRRSPFTGNAKDATKNISKDDYGGEPINL
jgi:hypothetical protein